MARDRGRGARCPAAFGWQEGRWAEPGSPQSIGGLCCLSLAPSPDACRGKRQTFSSIPWDPAGSRCASVSGAVLPTEMQGTMQGGVLGCLLGGGRLCAGGMERAGWVWDRRSLPLPVPGACCRGLGAMRLLCLACRPARFIFQSGVRQELLLISLGHCELGTWLGSL